MAEYIEKQVAIDALHEAYEARNPTQNAIMDKATMVIFRLPPADVRPVVLCGKCQWFDDIGYPAQDSETPELRTGFCSNIGFEVQACWFCADGKRGDAE